MGIVVVGLGLSILSVATHAPKPSEAPAPQSSDAAPNSAPNPEVQPGTGDATPGMTNESPVTAETAPVQVQDQAGSENPPASADARAAMPEATQETSAPGLPADEAMAPRPAPLADAAAPAASAAAPTMPTDETAPITEPGPGLPDTDDSAAHSAAPAPGAAPDVAGAEAPAPVAPGAPPALEAGQSPEASPTGEAPPVQALAPEPSPAPAPSPAIGTPVVPLTERAPASSLPTVGTGSQTENAGATTETGAADEEAADPRALVRNAAAFDNPEGLPVMSVLLIDVPETRTALGDLAGLPFKATFVVPADAPDAAGAIAFYRGAGAEVALLLPLAPKSRPEDVEVTLEAYGDLLDQVVAVLIPAESGFQTMGPAATQLGAALADRGLGLVSLPQGLNTGHKSAAKAGAPAGLVFRELDNDGQSGSVISRFVDNAAFKARQDDGVILLAHVRPETVQALVEWSLGNRAKQVSLAPLSYLLSHQS